MDRNTSGDSLRNDLMATDRFHDKRRYLLRHNDGHTADNWDATDRDYVTRKNDNRGGKRRSLALLPLLLLPIIIFGALAFNTLQDAAQNNRALQVPQGEVGVGGGPDTSPTPIPSVTMSPTPTTGESNSRSNTVVPGVGGSGEETNIIPSDSPDVGYGTI